MKLVSGIVLSETEITLNEGQSATLTAIVSPEQANYKTLAWTSSDESIASVDESGEITAHIQGTAIITATSTDGSDVSASCTVTVVKLVSSIYISDTNVRMKIGEQATITAYALPSDATNPVLRWYSEDESVASVEGGVVTANGLGTTHIFVETTDGSNIKESCEVIVGDSGINLVSSEVVRVYVSNGAVFIENVPVNHLVYFILPNGTLVRKEVSTGDTITFRPASNGIYIVKTGSICKKIIL